MFPVVEATIRRGSPNTYIQQMGGCEGAASGGYGSGDGGKKAVGGDNSRSNNTGVGVTGSRGVCCDTCDELPPGAENPGLLRALHVAARNRIPQCFDGLNVAVRQRKYNWILGHSILLSSVTPGGYKAFASYLRKKKPGAMPYFVMEAAPGGQLSCEMRVGPTKFSRASVFAQIADSEIYSLESILDMYFCRATASVIAVNSEFIALQYLQAVTRYLSLGAEVVVRSRPVELSSLSVAGRWTDKCNSVSATLGNRGLEMCYVRAIRPHIIAAALLEISKETKPPSVNWPLTHLSLLQKYNLSIDQLIDGEESNRPSFSVTRPPVQMGIDRTLATMAYEWQAAPWNVRACVNSDGLVGATLQHGICGERAKFVISLSALLNHINDKFRLGVGFTAAIF
ncbi:Mitochondrial import receptor subunit TOM40 homolog 1 [Eumeta japonica]|uniref:Mitochondrial import receptor subunit TOM40 homolog 1 n=1 Tax=Eumeta variegata TaxID=151549 RepID=A0A4C1VF75_EUMVA|nr:Mitochondrial import receptor subunit TOM40 homolog 1 [Eumeta japonica]